MGTPWPDRAYPTTTFLVVVGVWWGTSGIDDHPHIISTTAAITMPITIRNELTWNATTIQVHSDNCNNNNNNNSSYRSIFTREFSMVGTGV